MSCLKAESNAVSAINEDHRSDAGGVPRADVRSKREALWNMEIIML